MCDVLWVLGDGDVILVVCALVLVTLESNSEGKSGYHNVLTH